MQPRCGLKSVRTCRCPSQVWLILLSNGSKTQVPQGAQLLAGRICGATDRGAPLQWPDPLPNRSLSTEKRGTVTASSAAVQCEHDQQPLGVAGGEADAQHGRHR